MRMEEAFYNIYMYLYNKNVLEYAQIARSGPKSMIRNIEGRSTIHFWTRKANQWFISKNFLTTND